MNAEYHEKIDVVDGIDQAEEDEIYHLKCGEVLVSNGRSFLLCCLMCDANFRTLKAFIKHITTRHSVTEFDQKYNHNNHKSNDIDDYQHDDDDDISYNLVENFCETEINDKLPCHLSVTVNDINTEKKQQLSAAAAADDDDDMNPSKFQTNNDTNTSAASAKQNIEDNLNKCHAYANKSQDININDVLPPPLPQMKHNDNDVKTVPPIKIKKYPCQWCNKVYLYSSSLNKHNRKQHILDLNCFICAKCNIQFAEQKLLLAHAKRKHKTYTTNKLLKCTQCPDDDELFTNSYKTKKELKKHELHSHTTTLENAKFKCHSCLIGFNFKKYLIEHEQTVHVDQRPFQCEICSFRFKEKKHLIRHERSHTGEKPFECGFCDEKFTRMDKKKAHHLKKHESQLN